MIICDNHRAGVHAEGVTSGTPRFMSPEQRLGKKWTVAPIFATGVLLFECWRDARRSWPIRWRQRKGASAVVPSMVAGAVVAAR